VFVTGRAIRRFGELGTVMIGISVAVVTFTAINFVTAGWMVFELIALGSLTGLVFPGINALLSRGVDSANQGALQGAVWPASAALRK
jgi:DHA1 family tetracycline resistance protein-like MFS transporter